MSRSVTYHESVLQCRDKLGVGNLQVWEGVVGQVIGEVFVGHFSDPDTSGYGKCTREEDPMIPRSLSKHLFKKLDAHWI